MNEPQFSIIIPHHDAPIQLQRLLESVPWMLQPEVIVVDDVSTDENRQAAKACAEASGAQWYEVCRHTAGAARNEGLRHALGQWLVFADADDYFTPQARTLLQEMAGADADIIYFNVISAWSDSGRPAYRDRQVKRLIERCHREHSLMPLAALHTNPWGKMIRRSLVEEEGIRFEEIAAANDAMFSVKTGIKARKRLLRDEAVYCITVDNRSMTSNMTAERFECHGQARLRVNAYLRQQGWGKYQLSVLSYLLPAWRYGWCYGWRVLKACCADGNRPWVGLSRLLNPVDIIHSLKSRPK